MTTEKTTIRKSYHSGWISETRTDSNGCDYQISTLKTSGGRIVSRAQKGEYKNGVFSFIIFGDDSFTILAEKGTATEAAIKKQHAKALIMFDEIQAAKPAAAVAPYQIEIGQIIFTDFIQYDDKGRRAICEILPGGEYKAVLLDGSDIVYDSHLRPFKEKFGIGVYYNEGEKISPDEVNDLLITAHQTIKKRNEDKQSSQILAAAARSAKIEIGKQMVNIPAGVVAVIVGEHKVNESDSQSDYFGHSIDKVVYLAYSSHTRDLFPEMKKAAARYVDTAHLSTPETEEHKEKHTGGQGYYIGGWHGGWAVSKSRLTGYRDNAISEQTKEALYIAAAEGRYFCEDVTPAPVNQVKSINEVQAVPAPANVQILKYSERAFIVLGDTKPLKDELKGLGGKFNSFLTHPETTKKVAGWVFSVKQLEDVKAFLNQ